VPLQEESRLTEKNSGATTIAASVNVFSIAVSADSVITCNQANSLINNKKGHLNFLILRYDRFTFVRFCRMK
jgi:hypothetical protein